ncbi:MAG: hypothetical protein ACJ76W_05285 [Chloroflexota bacterium]
MSTERDVAAIVRSWLDEGSTRVPDVVLDSALAQIHSTPQRHGFWPARRSLPMNGLLKVLVAGAAVIAALAVGLALLPPSSPTGPGGKPSQTSATTEPSAASATSRPTPLPSPSGPRTLHRSAPELLRPGDYVIDQLFDGRITLRVPPNWTGLEHGVGNALLVKTKGALPFGTTGNTVLLGIYAVDGVYADPCKDDAPAEPRAATVDQVVDALTHAVGVQAGPVTDTTLGGLPAKVFELNNTIDEDGCLESPFNQWTFGDGSDSRGNGTSSGPDDHQRIWVLDVGGTTILVNADKGNLSYPDDIQEMLDIVEGLRFE